MGKMTAQEFKKVATDIGLDFDIYGYEGILNELSIYARAYSFEELAKGHKALADRAMKITDGIYRALDNRGYYDEKED